MRGFLSVATLIAACFASTLAMAQEPGQTREQLAWFQTRTIFHSGLVGTHTIALTFDDGPNARYPGRTGGAAQAEHQGDLLHRRADGQACIREILREIADAGAFARQSQRDPSAAGLQL